MHQLSVINLACERGDNRLFEGCRFSVKSGDWLQIEGHNGIGKTSLLRILAGLAVPAEGEVYWNNELIQKCREEYSLSTYKSHSDVLDLAETFTNEELFSKGVYKWTVSSTLGSYFASATSSHYDWAVRKLKAHQKTVRNSKAERFTVFLLKNGEGAKCRIPYR